MINSFSEMEAAVLASGRRCKVVLAGSDNRDALEALVNARRNGVVEAVLVGSESNTRELLCEMREPAGEYRFIDETDNAAISGRAFRLLSEGAADLPMKGGIQTAEFMRGIINKELGFTSEGRLLSQATVLEFSEQSRMMVISDCAVNISPDFEDKRKIIYNAVSFARTLGIAVPKVAVLAPLEKLNPKISATVDAHKLKTAWQNGDIADCVLDGPLALDNVMDIEAARAKGIDSPVAGCTDVMIMPDLAAGNIFTKSLHYFAHLKSAGILLGANVPVIMTSRTDSPEDKYYSILSAVYSYIFA